MTSRPGALADCRGQAALRECRPLSSQGRCFWLSARSSRPGPGLSARRPAPGGWGEWCGDGNVPAPARGPGAAQELSGSPPAAFMTLFVFFSPKKQKIGWNNTQGVNFLG